ncbi:MAG: protein kinase [Thermoanaerobaculia bacterium]|nr:protein kinase [Thermoanaerobaculia bacterium]
MSETVAENGTKKDRAPLQFDHYEVVRSIGRGAMGTVYLARDTRIGRLAALKTLRTADLPDPDSEESREFLARFRREAEVCGSLVHPNIVTLYEVGYEDEQIQYLAMEYVEGESLLAVLRRHGKLDVAVASRIILDILSGLGYAHERGVVHRDIKPANVLIHSRGHAKIADFGVARSVREGISHATKAGDLLGTPYYMAPEQIEGRGVDARSDLFSTGVLFYELLSGQRPFQGKAIMEILYDVVNNDESPLRSVAPEVPRWCEQFVSRLMRKNPDDRFSSAEAAHRELARMLDIGRREGSHLAGAEALTDLVGPGQSEEQTPTLPIHSRKAWWSQVLGRKISRRATAVLLAAVIAAVGLPLAWMSSQAFDDSPSISVPVERQEEFERKREMLEEARVLMDAGAYARAVERYEEILAEFPDTPAAEQGREEAKTRIFQLRGGRVVP